MQEKTKHPFQPGTEVAVVSGYDDGRFTKCKVLKIYKNGNFVVDAPAYRAHQWKPDTRPVWGRHNDRALLWYAQKTGRDIWSRYSPAVRLWDQQLIDELKAAQTKTRLEQRAKRAVHFVRDVFRPAEMTEWQIEALEYAIKLYKGCPTKPEGAT